LDKLVEARTAPRAAEEPRADAGHAHSEGRRGRAIAMLEDGAGDNAISPETAWALLQLYDVPYVRNVAVSSADEAAAAAGGFPGAVAVKVDSEHVAHKSELGLVALGLSTEDQVRAAYTEIDGRASALGLGRLRIVVQEMAPEGVEVLV